MAARQEVSITVNGKQVRHEVEPRLLLVHYLRDVLGLTGTHIGCDTSQCGACTVHLDGEAVKSCTVFAVQANGHAVKTIEAMAQNGTLHPLQEGFWEEHGLQCGYCTPGMIMSAADLLQRNPDPSEAEIRHALKGNLCRCTGYQHIVNAVMYAAKKAVGEPVAAGIAGATPERATASVGEAPAALVSGEGIAVAGTPTAEAWEQDYGAIRGVYPAITESELDEARAHPQGHLEGMVHAISRRTGETVDAVRARLTTLLHRRS